MIQREKTTLKAFSIPYMREVKVQITIKLAEMVCTDDKVPNFKPRIPSAPPSLSLTFCLVVSRHLSSWRSPDVYCTS
jgi:hypothetical protein